MSELISGKEAKLLLAQENEVQYLDTRSAFKTLGWCDANDLTGCQFSMKHYQFRLKPRTITINGMDLPTPFEPKEGEWFYFIKADSENGYSSRKLHDDTPKYLTLLGAWRTEDEIRQVVVALRKVFKGG